MGLRLRLRELCVACRSAAGAWSRPLETCSTAGTIPQTGSSGHFYCIGGIGFFNKEDSTRKGGTVQVRTSERIIRAE